MLQSIVPFNIIQIVVTVVLVIVSIVIHEVSHGWVAYKLGDPTAKNAGRLTLNPLKHLDPLGSFILPFVMSLSGGPVIGYAKPVPYNPRYFEDIRKGELLVGLSGPASNLAQALVGALLAAIVRALFGTFGADDVAAGILSFLFYVATTYVFVNLVLMFFNLIPLPPLDGSSIIAVFLNDKQLQTYYKVQQYSLFILLLLFFGVPMLTGLNPVGAYLSATAGNLYSLLIP